MPLAAALVVQTSFLGDTVLTTPLLADLAGHGPVDVVVTPAAAGVLANHPAVRTVIAYDKRGRDSGARGFARLAGRLRAERYAVAYLAQGSLRSAALALVAAVPERVGFATSAGRVLYTRRVPYREDEHHAARLIRLARPSDDTRPVGPVRPRLYPGAAEQDAVAAILTAAGLDSAPFVAFAPGSVWATKRWPHYPELAERLAAHGVPIVLVGGPGDADAAAVVMGAVGGARSANAVGRLSLLGSAELIGRAAVLVTNDSAPQHLASAMGTPTVAIFGPTVPGFGFGPLAPRSTVAEHQALACRPCDRHGPPQCPLAHWRCMRELIPSSVEREVLELLSTAHS